MKRLSMFFISVIITAALIFGQVTEVSASGYNYDFWGNPIPSSEGLTYKTTYHGLDFTAADGSGETLDFSASVQNIQFYGDYLYVLDGRDQTNDEIDLVDKNGNVNTGTIKSNSYLYVINSDNQWVEKRTFFKLADAKKDYLLEKMRGQFNFRKDYRDVVHSELSVDEIRSRAPYASGLVDGKWEVGLYLNNAQGLTVTNLGIYIGDSENSRILRLNFNFEVEEIILTPNEETFLQPSDPLNAPSKLKFRPIRLAVDRTGRIYCIAKDAFVGILEFDELGTFNRFLGKNLVIANAWEAFLAKWFYSEAQLIQKGYNLPPQFSNLTIDDKGFLFTTSDPNVNVLGNQNLIKQINTSGKDVLRRNGYIKPDGDNRILVNHNNRRAILGSSNFSAIAVNSDGIYTAVDKVRGRLFTYDTEGNLLYVTGDTDYMANEKDRADAFNEPVAIVYHDVKLSNGDIEQQVYILDRKSRSIVVYTTTEFGKLVNKATSLYLNSSADDATELGYDPIIEAAKVWEQVIAMNSNYQLAYVGIGKSLLRQGLYKEAMDNFELGQNRVYYSKAFQLYRDDIIKENFNLIMTGFIVTLFLVAGLVVYKRINKSQIKRLMNEVEDDA